MLAHQSHLGDCSLFLFACLSTFYYEILKLTEKLGDSATSIDLLKFCNYHNNILATYLSNYQSLCGSSADVCTFLGVRPLFSGSVRIIDGGAGSVYFKISLYSDVTAGPVQSPICVDKESKA